MTYASAAVLTMNGTDYDPLTVNFNADNTWWPTFKATATLPLSKMVAPALSTATNLITNPSASVDLTNANYTGLTNLVRQAPAQGIACAHGTAFRLNGAAATSDSFMVIGGDSGAMRLGMVAGKTYTVSGSFYLDGALAGTADAQGRARKIVVYAVTPGVNGGSAYILGSSAQAANAQGQTRLSLTFTIPATSTQVWVRWYHGHAGTSAAYWTDLQLVEGAGVEVDGTPVPFFDGDSVDTVLYNYDWTGTAGKSTSTRTLAFNSILTSPVVDPRATPYPTARLRYWFGDSAAPDLIYDVTLLVRTYIIDEVEDTVTLSLLSHEILLQDYKNGDADYAPGAMALTDMFKFAMRKIQSSAYNISAIPPVTIPAVATVWKAGQSLDDWLRGALRSQGVDMYYDAFWFAQFTVYFLSNPTKAAVAGGQMNAIWGRNVLSSRSGVDVDNENYADAAVAVFQWVDAAGASQRKSYTSLPPGPYRKVFTQTYESADPGYNPADSLRIRASRSGRTQEISMLPSPSYNAVAPFSANKIDLGPNLWYQRRDGSLMNAIIQRFDIAYPADTMTVGLIYPTERTGSPSPLPIPQA